MKHRCFSVPPGRNFRDNAIAACLNEITPDRACQSFFAPAAKNAAPRKNKSQLVYILRKPHPHFPPRPRIRRFQNAQKRDRRPRILSSDVRPLWSAQNIPASRSRHAEIAKPFPCSASHGDKQSQGERIDHPIRALCFPSVYASLTLV